MVKSFAKEEKLEYIEMSAKSGKNVEEVISVRTLFHIKPLFKGAWKFFNFKQCAFFFHFLNA